MVDTQAFEAGSSVEARPSRRIVPRLRRRLLLKVTRWEVGPHSFRPTGQRAGYRRERKGRRIPPRPRVIAYRGHSFSHVPNEATRMRSGHPCMDNEARGMTTGGSISSLSGRGNEERTMTKA